MRRGKHFTFRFFCVLTVRRRTALLQNAALLFFWNNRRKAHVTQASALEQASGDGRNNNTPSGLHSHTRTHQLRLPTLLRAHISSPFCLERTVIRLTAFCADSPSYTKTTTLSVYPSSNGAITGVGWRRRRADFHVL